MQYKTKPMMRYESEQIWFPLSKDISNWEEDFHELMLNDHIRMTAYEKAIKEVVKQGMKVVDIGTGTGILALWALEAGAKKVYGIEVNQKVIPQTLERIAKAGYSKRFEVYNAHSYDVALPERVDIIISELLGNLGDNENMTPILADAKKRFLKKNRIMLPKQVKTYLVPISSVKAHQQVLSKECKGINSRYKLENLMKNDPDQFKIYYDCIIPEFAYLSRPQIVREFNFDDNESEYEIRIRYTINKVGIFTGFKGYFTAQLSDKTILDISKDNIEERETSDCWKHCYLPIKKPIEVKKGDQIELTYSRTNPQKYTWKARVRCAVS